MRVKGDERILGGSDFVENVLKAADEKLEQKYALMVQGYDFKLTVQRLAQVGYGAEGSDGLGEITANGEGQGAAMFFGRIENLE